MKQEIFYAPYELKPKHSLNALTKMQVRRGFLLKIDGGFADCHPWSEWGDAPLEKQLEALKCGQSTPLLERSFYFAQLDSAARLRGESLWMDLEIPPSHATVTDL